ncbi:MAG: hypothetical protein A2487_14835 [Candidatus Raymondbacteria bacterium RifOxyC12_full_50_8]|uniref:Uncharacterized protein n=1 Tax=Candidatus Raymondbacteria bacterium RIFOXYD12_FULL_49_13 TaxID=1817890 RepID=A0A1F7FIM3_UNCRA|nr:MAG: hypothetical protein A2248_21365 [Candidatus Raymondbacteria bacterium RIFOXYA2_FULL_49_16]OGJ97433.1 MAG: hypothetical protein A2487_14835 [Candidatus Raymondbacteria bacterium RifOxyC12_full_50_8]OGJ98657.1 MAG: hypothetical protein A2350_14015 [Candidatus Raymondbacteria bacterium RifOxyB12_full_50_8]OGK06337.1 MAG: hypothetical protein A2519_08685 [Candidatus Raymondbacteria bacterium RIFOXYD12_FULL_49_13]OGP40671.1 MAG: hypothetical protein A2324_03435 [Candidatus Raymondbacteria b
MKIIIVLLFSFSQLFALKFMTFNILDGATTAWQHVLNIIRNSGAEIITINEANDPSIFYRIADSLGYYRVLSVHNTYNVGILSKYDIKDSAIYTSSTLSKSLLEAKIEVSPDTFIYVFTSHFYPFGTDNERRLEEIKEILPIMAAKSKFPILFAGDLNSQSQLDGLSGDYGAVTTLIADSGFSDVYRSVYPDHNSQPGFTYNAQGAADRRIDYIFINSGFNAVSATVLDSGDYAQWPSDHFAVFADLDVGSIIDTTPPEISSIHIENDTIITITFSEPLDSFSASNPSNYCITNDIVVKNASLDQNGCVVTLLTLSHTLGNEYMLTAREIKDIADMPNSTGDTGVSAAYLYMIVQKGDTCFTFEDTYVSGAAPTTNYGAEHILHIDGDQGIQIAFLKFDLSAFKPDSLDVDSVHLVVKVANGTYSNSAFGGNIMAVYDNSWSENTVTFAAQPSISQDTLGSFSQVNNNQIHEIRLNNTILLGETLSVALATDNSDAAEYFSKEGGYAAYLVVYAHERISTLLDDVNGGFDNNITVSPNPFNSCIAMQYRLDQETMVNLSIYKVSGQKIKRYSNEKQSPGLKRLIWEAKDDFGNDMAAGVYLCHFQFDNGFQTVKRILLVK